jgi:hypothetical protein
MKKIFVLVTAALLVSGVSFAQDKKCGKGCCKKGSTACKEKANTKAEKKDKTAKI